VDDRGTPEARRLALHIAIALSLGIGGLALVVGLITGWLAAAIGILIVGVVSLLVLGLVILVVSRAGGPSR
jgi:hypothetical protein